MGLLTDQITETLMSSDPRLKQIRRGILSEVGKYAGPQPVAPTMGQVFSTIPSGIAKGESNYLQNELRRFQLEQIKAPNQQIVGGPTTGYKLVQWSKTPELLDDGSYGVPEMQTTDIMGGVFKAEAPKSYYNIDDESKVISMTATEYAKKPDKEKWIPFTAKTETKSKYSKILTASDITKLNELGYGLKDDVNYEVKFTEKTDLNKPIEEIISESVGWESVGGKGTTIYTGDIPIDLAEKAKGEAIKSQSTIARGFNLISDIEKLGKGGVGIRPWIAENLGGVIGQVSEPAEKAFSKFIAGADPSAITKFRVDARQFIGQSITRMTGEESGRYTEAERKITQDALALVNAAKTPLQVYGALVSVIEAEFLAADRNEILANSGNPEWKPRFDLNKKEDFNALGELLEKEGLLQQDVFHIINRMKKQRNIKGLF